MGQKDFIGTFVRNRFRGSVKVAREPTELEEGASVGDGEFPVSASAVDEEVDRQGGDAVRDDVPNVLESEGRVRGNGVLNQGVAQLASDGDVVGAISVAVTEVDELFG